MSALSRVVLASAIAVVALLPLPSSVATVWDVQAQYTIDDATGTVDFSLTGAYTSVIQCPNTWNQIDSSSSSVPSGSHVVTYSWSYLQGQLLVTEQTAHVLSSKTYSCAGFTLAPVSTSPTDWHQVVVRDPWAPACSGGWLSWRPSGVVLGSTSLSHYVLNQATGICVATRAAQTTAIVDGLAPFSGTMDATWRNQGNGVVIEAPMCDLIVGQCWDNDPNPTTAAWMSCPSYVDPQFCLWPMEITSGTSSSSPFRTTLLPAVGNWEAYFWVYGQ